MKKIVLLIMLFSNLCFSETVISKGKIIPNKFKPTTITVDGEGNIYTGSHFVNALVKYNSDYKKEFVLNFKESNYITDIYSYGNSIWILFLNGKVLCIDSQGILLKEFNFPKGKLLGELDNPNGIFIDKDIIYIADTGNARIVKVNFKGQMIDSFGYKTSNVDGFSMPNAINKLGQYYVVLDESLKEIKLFDENGFYESNLKDQNKNKYFLVTPKDLYVDKERNLYISDFGRNQIVVFTNDGKMRVIGEKGSTKNKFFGVKDIWVNDKYIYVADTMNRVIKIMDKNNYEVIKVLGKNNSNIYIISSIILLLVVLSILGRKLIWKKGDIIE